VDLVPGSWR